MKPLFFPFTHVRQQDARALSACFKGFCHFSVSASNEVGAGNPGIDVVLPAPDELMPALAKVEDYKQWAGVNHGRPGQLKSRVRETPYFTSDTGIATLKSRIEQESGEIGSGDQAPVEPVDSQAAFLSSLVFLRTAQESDADTEEVNARLCSIARDEAALFSVLKDGAPLAKQGDGSCVPDQDQDPGRVMTEKRILAWARFFREKIDVLGENAPLVPVTTSRAVVDYFHSKAKKSIKVLDIENFKVHEGCCEHGAGWQGRLKDLMENAIFGSTPGKNDLMEADDGCGLLADIQLYLFSGDHVSNIFCPTDREARKNALIRGSNMEIPVCLVSVRNNNT
ncbi:MAG: hypothetical protein GY737_06485 [Desulfobacteraceae bacterium]|nr:hypothetical protein [Desulfobacteraceae bacterium]